MQGCSSATIRCAGLAPVPVPAFLHRTWLSPSFTRPQAGHGPDMFSHITVSSVPGYAGVVCVLALCVWQPSLLRTQFNDVCFGGAPELTEVEKLFSVFPTMDLHFDVSHAKSHVLPHPSIAWTSLPCDR